MLNFVLVNVHKSTRSKVGISGPSDNALNG
jgi:hypothetical protein